MSAEIVKKTNAISRIVHGYSLDFVLQIVRGLRSSNNLRGSKRKTNQHWIFILIGDPLKSRFWQLDQTEVA